MSSLTHLRSVDISVADPAELLRFYEQIWGLRRVAGDDGHGIALRARGTEHHVLRLVGGKGYSLERIELGVVTDHDVDALAGRLAELGIQIVSGPARRAHCGGYYSVEFLDPEGRLIEVSAGLGEHDSPLAGSFGPDRLSHIVLNSVDLAASRAFYLDVLGFEISDRYENDLMVFLRCNNQHHCVVLAPGKWTSLNHVAFEVGSAEEVMRQLGRMRKAGYQTIWGPGRHGPGGNVFCYFQDPAGNVIEYTAELIEVDEDWIPRTWARTGENADVWGTSGGITPEVARAMSNPPVDAR